MAQEITLNLSVNFSKNGANIARNTRTTVDVAGTKYTQAIQNVGTSDESLDKGDVGTIGYVYLKNLDPTNYVDFGADGTNYPLRLKPGEQGLVRWNGTVHAKAHTGACDLEYIILED